MDVRAGASGRSPVRGLRRPDWEHVALAAHVHAHESDCAWVLEAVPLGRLGTHLWGEEGAVVSTCMPLGRLGTHLMREAI
jgi:hypothetical protein